jgi:oxygen-independent coproporphyrinogen-3 oxidase
LGGFCGAAGRFSVEPEAEITLEAAPGQIADEVLDAAMRLGVNRVSLGVQSFVDRESARRWGVRIRAGVRAEIARLRAAGVQEVGADLIAGLPYQTQESFGYSLDDGGVCGADAFERVHAGGR